MHTRTFHIDLSMVTRLTFVHTIVWALFLSMLIVIGAAGLARATLNLDAGLTKPDLAIYLLNPDEEIGETTLLREKEHERDYLAETKDGPKLIRLKESENGEWYVALKEPLHAD